LQSAPYRLQLDVSLDVPAKWLACFDEAVIHQSLAREFAIAHVEIDAADRFTADQEDVVLMAKQCGA
jgi:hypothetical protein